MLGTRNASMTLHLITPTTTMRSLSPTHAQDILDYFLSIYCDSVCSRRQESRYQHKIIYMHFSNYSRCSQSPCFYFKIWNKVDSTLERFCCHWPPSFVTLDPTTAGADFSLNNKTFRPIWKSIAPEKSKQSGPPPKGTSKKDVFPT